MGFGSRIYGSGFRARGLGDLGLEHRATGFRALFEGLLRCFPEAQSGFERIAVCGTLPWPDAG